MRKLLLTILSAVVLLTGCGINIPVNIMNSSESNITTEDDVAEATVEPIKEVSVTPTAEQVSTNTIQFDSIFDLFENKFTGMPEDIEYTKYFVTYGKSPVYLQFDIGSLYGSYDFGDDFVSVGYNYLDRDIIARVHLEDENIFNFDTYIREELDNVFNVSNPEVKTIKDMYSDGSENITITMYTADLNNDNYKSVSYGVFCSIDEETRISYTTILLTAEKFEEFMQGACSNFNSVNVKVRDDVTYMSTKTNSFMNNGVYTVTVHDQNNYYPTKETVTYKFPNKFIIPDYNAKDIGERDEIGMYKQDYGILVIIPQESTYSAKDNEQLTYYSIDFKLAMEYDSDWNNVDTDYRNGYICSSSYATDTYDIDWAYEDGYSYHLSEDQIDYFYISRDYPIVVMFRPINDNSVSVDEFKELIDEILDAGITVKEIE